MKRLIQIVLAVVGTVVCVYAARMYWGSKACPVPHLVLVELTVLGMVGIVVVAKAREGASPRWGRAAWAVFGALLAVAVITVWSTMSWVSLALLLFGM